MVRDIKAIRIIVIDSELSLHSALRSELQRHYEGKGQVVVCQYLSADKAFAGLAYDEISCVVLSSDLVDYLEDLVINLKSSRGVPVVVLSNFESPVAKIRLMEMGVDIILNKPINFKEYYFAVRNLLNLSHYALDQRSYDSTYKKLSLRFAQREIVFEDKHVILTTKEYDVLQSLLNNSGRYLTVEQIYSYAWNDELQTDSVEKSVRDVIYRIRKKLNESCEGVSVESKYGYGYRILID